MAHADVHWTTSIADLLNADLNVVVEAASHEVLEKFGEDILKSGIDLIPSSLGAFVDGHLYQRMINAAIQSGACLLIPSGGIGGLDALKAVIHAKVDFVTMTTRKPPVAWKKIPFVEEMNLDLENISEPTLLFNGPARDCVKKFPQNINIAAALSLAGTGFEKTQIRIMADPTVNFNTHEIEYQGEAGRFRMVLENLAVPENPKTTYMACLSVLASLKQVGKAHRVGT